MGKKGKTDIGLKIRKKFKKSRTNMKTAEKWQKCNLVSGMASVASNMGWL